jgi:hypothetical protein
MPSSSTPLAFGGTTAEFLLPSLVGVEDWRLKPLEVRKQSDVWALGRIAGLMADALDYRVDAETRMVSQGIAHQIQLL